MSLDETQPALRVTNATVRYGRGVIAVRELSLTVYPVEVVTLMGLNGAGKTSLVRAVTGLLRANGGSLASGRIESFGNDITRRSARAIVRNGVAQTLEGRRVFTALSVKDNLEAGGATRSRREVAASMATVMEAFPRLKERADQAAGLLSGGEQQMLAFGRALMSSPRLLILDEPTLGLAPKIVGQIAEAVRDIKRKGTAVLLIEQNAAMALSVADRGYLMQGGSVFREGTSAELRADPDLRRRLLGLEDAA